VAKLKTDFCLVGFPKCGTTALVRLLAASPALNLARTETSYETPIFFPKLEAKGVKYVRGKPNGHKFSAYIYSPQAMEALIGDSPKALIILSVRDSASALMSWRDMHRKIATDNRKGHFTTASEEARAYYMNCSLEEYFHSYADSRLNYAAYIRELLSVHPGLNYLIIGQRRLSEDARGVMTEIHDRLKVKAPQAYLDELPQGYRPRGNRDITQTEISPDVTATLAGKDQALLDFLATLPQDRVMLAADGRL
jgi:hypothetical protein